MFGENFSFWGYQKMVPIYFSPISGFLAFVLPIPWFFRASVVTSARLIVKIKQYKAEMCNRWKKATITITITITFRKKSAITITITIILNKRKKRLRLQLRNRSDRLPNRIIIDYVTDYIYIIFIGLVGTTRLNFDISTRKVVVLYRKISWNIIFLYYEHTQVLWTYGWP